MQQKVQDQLASIQTQLKTIQGQLTAQAQAVAQKSKDAVAQATQKSKDAVAQLTPQQKKAVVGVAAALGVLVVARVGFGVSAIVSRRRRLAQIAAQKEDGKVHLYIRPRSPWAPSASPHCSKVETFLRLANIEYEAIETMDTFPSPNECLPFIVYRGQVMAESKRIIEFLSTEFHVPMDSKLNRLERATGTALVDMIDYSMNPTFYRIAFVLHPSVGTHMIAKTIGVPKFVAGLIVGSFAAKMQAAYNVTAYGSLTPEQYENEFLRDCEAVEQQIAEKPFLFGDEPTSYDCAVYALFIPFVNMKSYAEVSEAYMAVSQSPILVDYLHRLTERAFPDLEELMVATNVARSEIAESMAGDEMHAEEHEAPEDAARGLNEL